jgi:hypothetical protein
VNENKRERLRKVMEELRNTINKSPVAPGEVLSQDSVNECLKMNWVRKDEMGFFVPTELGKAMARGE